MTTKIVVATAVAICVVTSALLSIAWEWEAGNAVQIQTDCHRQLINAIERSDAATLRSETGDTLRDAMLGALPSRVHLKSLKLTDPTGKVIAQALPLPNRNSDDTSFTMDSLVSSLAGYLSALPSEQTVTTDVQLGAQSGHPQPAHLTAVLDMRDQRTADAYLLAEIIQIFLPIALACLLALYFSVQQWVHRPAQAIIRVAHRIAEGDQGLRLAISAYDEFGQIMKAFNDLTDALLATQQQADTDGLTQVFNHRYLQEQMSETLHAANQSGRPMSVILIDLNKFKLLNDTYGHLVGDRFLQVTASVLRRAIHLDGIVGRYGGDEFLIILPHAGKERATVASQRIRTLMAAEQFHPSQGSESLPIQFSMGVAVFPENGRSAQEMVAYADAALYTEKQGGYNLVELTRDIESEYALKCSNGEHKAQPGGLFGTLFSLVVAVDNKDSYTKKHSVHVADWAVRLGQAIGLPSKTLRALQVAGLLHDVGKIGVPDSILRKPGPLDEQEQEIMAGHIQLSERLIQEVPYQDQVIEAVSCHHERWDGKGYPHGKSREDMPVVGRIMSLVDAYSAMCLDRPYRRALPVDDICEKLAAGAGTQFDPALVTAFIDLIKNQEPGQLLPDEEGKLGKLKMARDAEASQRKKLPDAA